MSSDIGDLKRLVVIRQRLIDAGVTKLVCQYSGSGDSGQFDGMTCVMTETDKATGATLLGGDVDFYDVPGIGVDTDLARELEDLFWDKITEHHAGWENNDGGEGTFTWTLATDHLEYVHHDFYLERHTTRLEGW